MTKKLLALILAILMVLPAIVSCGGKTEKPSGGINYDESANNDVDTDDEEEE